MVDWNPVFIILLLLAVLPLERLAQRYQYPVAAMLFAFGALAAAVFVDALGKDTGLRWYNFEPIILNLFLPAMVFSAVMNLPLKVARQSAALMAWLVLPLGMLGALAIATAMYHSIGHASGFPWTTALVAGALLTAVDPGPVLALNSARMIPENLRVLLAGESLFKDVTSILLFSVLLALPAHSDTSDLPQLFSYRFIEAVGIGVSVGALCGYIGSRALPWLRQNSHNLMLATLLMVYGCFLLATSINGSGIVAVLLCGLLLRLLPLGSGGIGKMQAWQFGKSSWNFASCLMERLMLMLGGATLSLGMFKDHWRTMLYAIAIVVLVRALLLLLTWLTLRCTSDAHGNAIHSWRHAIYMLLGGGSGVVTLSLALALPLELSSWYTVQSAAYGVVIFYLFVQAPAISWLSRHSAFSGSTIAVAKSED